MRMNNGYLLGVEKNISGSELITCDFPRTNHYTKPKNYYINRHRERKHRPSRWRSSVTPPHSAPEPLPLRWNAKAIPPLSFPTTTFPTIATLPKTVTVLPARIFITFALSSPTTLGFLFTTPRSLYSSSHF